MSGQAKLGDGWRKSTRSSPGECVEAKLVESHVHVRDSKNPHGPALVFTTSEWSAFLIGVRSGEFDLPEPS